MWSLQIELIAVPLIFAAFIMYRCWGTPPLVILLVSLAAMSFWGPWSHLLGRSIPLGILFSFIAGMVAFTSGRICVQHVPSNLQPQLFVGAVLLFFLSRPLLGFASHWSVIAEVYASTVMVSLLTFGDIGKFGKMFDSKSARFYGRISYSLYILHPLTLIVIWHIPDAIAAALAAGVPYLVVAALLPVLSIAAITPLAWAMWRFVERPGIEAGRWLNARIVGTKAKPKIEPIPPLSA